MRTYLRFVFALCLTLPLWADSTPASGQAPRTDLYGDPLPDGAVARLGTLRLRHPSRDLAGVAIVPDGKLIVTIGEESLTVCVWDAATGKEVRRLQVRDAMLVRHLAFSPDGTRLAAGFLALSPFGKVHSWDAKTGKELRRWDAFTDLNKQGRVYYIYGPAEFSREGTLFTAHLELLEINGQRANDPGFMGAVWNVAERKLLRRAPERGIGTIAPDGKRVVAGDGGDIITLCDLLTGKELQRFPLPKDRYDFLDLAVAPDGKRLVTAFGHQAALVWDVGTGKVVKEFALPGWESRGAHSAAAFFPDGERLLLMVNNYLSIWNTRTGKEVLSWAGHRQPVNHLTFTADGKRLLSGNGESWKFPQRLLAWETGTWQAAGGRRLSEDELYRSPAPVSPDHTLALVIREGRKLHLYDRASGKPVRKLDAAVNQYTPGSSFISSNGELAVLSISDNSGRERFQLLDLRSGRTLCVLPAEACKIRFAFAPDNRHVAWFERDETIHVMDAATGKIVWRLGKPHEDQSNASLPHALVFSPDGRYLASGSTSDNTVRVWSLQTGKRYRELSGAILFTSWGRGGALAFSRDGKMLAAGSLDSGGKDVEIWELVTGQRRRRFSGHALPVTALAFSPEGRWLASGSDDTTILVWGVTERK